MSQAAPLAIRSGAIRSVWSPVVSLTRPITRGQNCWKPPVSSTVKASFAGASAAVLKTTLMALPPWPRPQPWSTSTSNSPGFAMLKVHSAASVGRVQKPSVCLASAGS